MPPIAPQELAALRLRIPAALEPVFDMESLRLGLVLPPEDRDGVHLFDFHDGLRVMVTREDGAHPGGIHLHASVSLRVGTYLYASFLNDSRRQSDRPVPAARLWLPRFETRVRQLVDPDGPAWAFGGQCARGWLHWYRKAVI